MKRWFVVAIFILVSACSTPPPQPTTIPDSGPTSAIATVVPIPTLLPTVTTNAVQVLATPAPLTVTPVPTRAVPNSPKPAALKYPAPILVSPQSSARFRDGNDIEFVYGSVGALKANECYLLHVELVSPGIKAGNRGDDFMDVAHCGDPGPSGKNLDFVLYRGKFTNSPNYGTILQQVVALAPNVRDLKMTWTMRVVQNNGRAADGVHYNTIAVSPTSPRVEFDFQP